MVPSSDDEDYHTGMNVDMLHHQKDEADDMVCTSPFPWLFFAKCVTVFFGKIIYCLAFGNVRTYVYMYV